MKRPLLLSLIFLPGVALTALAQPPAIRARIVSIEKSGTAAVLRSLPDSGLTDSQLFDSLMADVARGSATVVADQQVLCGGSRSKVEAVRQIPVPVEAEIESGFVRMIPEFTGDYPGQTWEMEGFVTDGLLGGVGRKGIDLNMAPMTRVFLQRHPCPWPAPDAGRADAAAAGPLSLPLMSAQKTAAQLLTWTGNTVLISVSPGPADRLREGEPSCRYQFIRAGLDGEKPAPAGPSWTSPELKPEQWQARLHLITFRLPTPLAVSLTLNSGEDPNQAGARDSALYQRLRALAAEGTAEIAGSCGVVARAGQRSKVEGWTEVSCLSPSQGGSRVGWENFQIGESMETELSLSDIKRRVVRTADNGTRVESYREPASGGPAPALNWNLALELSGSVEEIPADPSARGAEGAAGAAAGSGFADVEFLKQMLSCQVSIPPSGILRVGLVSQSPVTWTGGTGSVSTSGSEVEAGAEAEEEAGAAGGEAPQGSSDAGSGSGADRADHSRGSVRTPQGEPATTDIIFALQSPAALNPAAGAGAAADSGSGQVSRPVATVSETVGLSHKEEATADSSGGQIEYHALMLSLTEAEGRQWAAALKSTGGPVPAADLIPRVQSGAIPCAAQAAGVNLVGQRATIRAVRNFLEERVAVPDKSGGASTSGGGARMVRVQSPVMQDGSSKLTGWSRAECGFEMEFETGSGDNGDHLEASVRIHWDTAPLLSSGEATALSLPRRCTQRIDLENLKLLRSQPVIADVRPSNARPGTPEHGRWHALLLIVR